MRENHKDYAFAQNIIADLLGESTSTISRVIKDLGIDMVNVESKKVKKYSIEDTRQIAQHLSAKDEFSKKTHVFYNLKGGTGKTSICAQLASHLAIIGYNVLIVDCDPQGHMTSILGFPEEENHLTMYDVLVNDMSIIDAVTNVMPGLDAILSNLSLSRVEVPLSQKARREEKIKSALQDSSCLTPIHHLVL